MLIQTHSGQFHADDVGAVSLLTSYYNQKNTKVHLVRSRNISILTGANILVDVGGVYDPATHRYDHHQTSCHETFSDDSTIPLSSIGMIWKHFGEELLEMFIKSNDTYNKYPNWETHIKNLWIEVYFKSIREMDGHDNGVLPVEGGDRNYQCYMTIGSIISALNSSDTHNDTAQMKAFQKAVGVFFVRSLETFTDAGGGEWLAGEEVDLLAAGTRDSLRAASFSVAQTMCEDPNLKLRKAIKAGQLEIFKTQRPIL